MFALRPFLPQDLLSLSLTNLDPLTENYDLGFYTHYLATWPDLCTVAEDINGNIVGYSRLLFPLYSPLSAPVPSSSVVCVFSALSMLADPLILCLHSSGQA